MASLHCRFSIPWKAAPGSPIVKKTKTDDFMRCKAACGRVSRSDTSQVVNQATGIPTPAKDIVICPVLAAGAAIAAAASATAAKIKQDAKDAEKKAEAAARKDEKEAEEKRRSSKRGRDGAHGSGSDDDSSLAFKWTEKNSGMTDDQLVYFPLTFDGQRWTAILASIKGRSLVDMKQDIIKQSIADLAKGSSAAAKTDEARANVRILMYKAVPTVSDLRSIAGRLAVHEKLQAMDAALVKSGSPPLSVTQAAIVRGESSNTTMCMVVMESVGRDVDDTGRNWIKKLFLKLVEESKGEVTQYIFKDGGKRTAAPSAERFAQILIQSHVDHMALNPTGWTMPALMSLLTAPRWAIPKRDTIHPWNALPLFAMVGVLVYATRANPEDSPLILSLAAMETHIRHCFSLWKDRFVHSAANEREVKKIAKTATAATAAAATAAAASAMASRIATEAAKLARANGSPPAPPTPRGAPPGTPSTTPLPNVPFTPQYHLPARQSYGTPAAPSPSIRGQGNGTQPGGFTQCQAPGCSKGPPRGFSKHPFCVDHAPPEQKAIQDANRAEWNSAVRGGPPPQPQHPFKPQPSFPPTQQFNQHTMMAPFTPRR